MPYDALISYSHSDERIALAIHTGLQRFNRPWYGPSRVRIFLDEADLVVASALEPAIKAALDVSRFFILLASPAAATSEWVQLEIEYWLQTHSPDTILIVLTDGEIRWSKTDFDWSTTTALPRQFASLFEQQPLHLDIRFARMAEVVTLADPRFLDAIAELTAAIRGVRKSTLIGEDVGHRRRAKQTGWSAASALALLAILAFWQRNTAQERLAANLVEEARVRIARGEIYAARSYLQQVFDLRSRDPIARVMAGVVLRREFELRPFTDPQGEPDPERNPEDPFDVDLPFIFAGFTRDSRRLAIVGGATAVVFDVMASPPRAIARFDLDQVDFDERNAALDPVHPRLALIDHGEVVVWDFEAQRATRRRFAGGNAHQVGFNEDGSTLAVALPDAVVLWRGSTETRIPKVSRFVWHPQGDSILTDDGFLRDVMAPERIIAALEHAAESRWLEFDPAGERIAGAGPKGLLLWSVSGGAPVAQLCNESFQAAHFSHDASRIVAIGERNLIVSASIPPPIEQYPPPERQEPPTLDILGTIRADDGAVNDAIFDPTDSYVFTAGLPAAARVWSGVTGEPIADVARSDEDIYTNEPYGSSLVRLSPDGRLLVTIGDYRTIARARLWRRGTELIGQLAGTKAAYSRDGKWLFTLHHGYVEARDAATLQVDARWKGNDYERVSSDEIAIVDGSRIVLCEIGTWAKADPVPTSVEIERLSISPDGAHALFFSSEQMLHVVDLEQSRVQCGMEVIGGRDAAWSADGSRIIVVGNDVQIWRAADCKLRQPPLELDDDAFLIDSVTVLDANRAALFSGTVTNGTGEMHRFIDIISLCPLKQIDELDASGFGIGQKLVGEGVVVDVDRRQASIIDVATGSTRVRLDGQSAWITSVAMSPDGALIATGDEAQSVKLWTAAGKKIATFEGHAAPITHVRFDPARERLLSEAEDGSIRIWDIAGAAVSYTRAAPGSEAASEAVRR